MNGIYAHCGADASLHRRRLLRFIRHLSGGKILFRKQRRLRARTMKVEFVSKLRHIRFRKRYVTDSTGSTHLYITCNMMDMLGMRCAAHMGSFPRFLSGPSGGKTIRKGKCGSEKNRSYFFFFLLLLPDEFIPSVVQEENGKKIISSWCTW